MLEKGIKAHGDNGNYLLLDLDNKHKAEKYVNHLKNKLIYVKGPWNKPWEKYITITIGPKHLMDQFLFETDNFLKNASK